jgi:hypothetical protein
MSLLVYPVTLTPDNQDGGFVVTFAHMPERLHTATREKTVCGKGVMLWLRQSRLAYTKEKLYRYRRDPNVDN